MPITVFMFSIIDGKTGRAKMDCKYSHIIFKKYEVVKTIISYKNNHFNLNFVFDRKWYNRK